MTFISRQELADYFFSRGNSLINSQGMQLRWYDKWGAFTSLALAEDIIPDSYELSIITSEEGLDDFIEGFRIENTKDIDKLGYKQVWPRYLNGQAEIQVTPMELEAAFSFRIYKSRTAISSLDLHFYDECYQHLSLPEEFLKYFTDNQSRLFAAVANRYKMH
jgi:hypothetical protein